MKTKSIQKKIMIVVSVINILIFSTILLYLQLVVKPSNEKNVTYLIRQNMETKAQEVNQWIEKRIVEYRTLAVIPAIRSMDIRLIDPIINQVTNSYKLKDQTMETFSFIGKNGFCWINAEATENLIRYDDYTKIYESDNEFLIGEPVVNDQNRKVVVFYYAINGYTGKKESLIASAVPLVRIEEIVNTVQLYNSKSWIMDSEHNIITSNENYISDNYLSKEYLKQIDVSQITTSTIIDVKGVQGDSKLIISPISSYPDWVLMTLVENKAINESVTIVIYGFLAVMLLLLVLTFVLGKYLSISVLTPIRKLQFCMNEAEKGNLKCYYPINSNRDEIYYLGSSFNQMIDELAASIDKIYRQEQEKRNAEMKILQEQIKPHFLYNTLDNIKWMAKKHGANDVADAISDLSTFFRLGLSHGDEFIELKQEFRHTKSYLDIQKMRYHDKFSYMIQLDPEIEHLKITKIILQPIVENAINHGIKNSTKNGTVQISGNLVEDEVILCVEDDGIGMNKEKVKELMTFIHDENSTHVGLRNIVARLENAYHDQFQFNIESWPMLGTKIEIRIKYKEMEKYVSRPDC